MIRSFTILVPYVCLELKIEIELFLKNQLKIFSPFFLQIPLRGDERKMVLYHLTNISLEKTV